MKMMTRVFILQGIRHSFSLINSHVDIENIAPGQVANNLSTGSLHIHPNISEAISGELQSGGYVKFSDKPKTISALSAIPKPDGGIRLMHDLSCPSDQSVNCGLNRHHIWLPVCNCIRMPVPKLAELFVMVTGFMCTGPAVCHTARHINNRGLAAVAIAVCGARNGAITILVSTQTIKWLINNGTARNSTCLDLLKHLASLDLEFNFTYVY